MSRARLGFTLVELVIVISLLAILAVGSVTFFGYSLDGYGRSAARAELAATSATALARISADLENALPNSVRVSGQCIEFVPVRESTRYLVLPRTTVSSTMSIESTAGGTAAPAPARLVVNPDSAARVYDLSSGVISPQASFSTPDGAGVITASFTAAHAFPEESPQERVYLVSAPASYCLVGDRLFRYSGYSYVAAQPSASDLPTASAQRALLVSHVAAAGTSFAYSAGSLVRNATVEIRLALARDDDSLTAIRLLHLRNVP